MLRSTMKKFSLQKNSDSRENILYDFIDSKSKLDKISHGITSQEMLASV